MTEQKAGQGPIASKPGDANMSNDPDRAAGLPSQELADRGGQAGGSDVLARKASDAHNPPHPAHSQLDTGGQIPAAAAAPAGSPASDAARTEAAHARAAGAPTTTAEGTVIQPPPVGSALVDRPRGVIPGDELDSPLASHTDDGIVDADLDPAELTNLNAGIADTHTQRRAAIAAQTRPSTRIQAIPLLKRELSDYEVWLEGKWRSLRAYQQELVNRLTGLGVAVPDEPYYEDFKALPKIPADPVRVDRV